MSTDTATRGLCSYDDPELWFTDPQEAKRICGRCPIAAACLRFALDHRIEHGVWGGTTEDERKELAKTHIPPAPRATKAARAEHRKTSDVKGVTWNRWRLRWEVIVFRGGKKHYGGTHTDKAAAEAKALAMHQAMGTNPVRIRPA